MFTGLVADRGTVVGVDATVDGARLTIASALAGDVREGDSVAIAGVCLTATGVCRDRFSADVMHETLRRTTLGDLADGAAVNLELALRATDRLQGHIVQGHVDGVGVVSDRHHDGFALAVALQADPEVLRYVVEKGSIAVDGVSLTVARVADDAFDVALIPETLRRTTLGSVAPGARVNLEVDVLAKYVERLMAAGARA